MSSTRAKQHKWKVRIDKLYKKPWERKIVNFSNEELLRYKRRANRQITPRRNKRSYKSWYVIDNFSKSKHPDINRFKKH